MPNTRVLDAERALIAGIRDAILRVEPDARIFLFGSRARGDARLDSDWDLLVLVAGQVTEGRRQRVRDQLYDLELETDTVLSAIIRSKVEWESPQTRAMPLYREIMRDGIEL